MGLSIEDRQILLTHTSSETTKIYTHPNFDLASEYVIRLPDYTEKFSLPNQLTGKRNQNVTKITTQ